MRNLNIATVGQHISAVAKTAVKSAQTEDVFFIFNDLCVPVTKADTVEDVCNRYDQLSDQRRKDYEGSDEQKAHLRQREERKIQERQAFLDFVETLKFADEEKLREVTVQSPQSLEDLTAVYTALAERSHDYGTSAYAMSIFAEAAFNLMASKMGATGFQASCADLDFIRRTRSIDGPFAIIKGNDMLYPQYDITTKVDEMLAEWRPWARTEATKLLQDRSERAHPNVIAHWESLANGGTT